MLYQSVRIVASIYSIWHEWSVIFFLMNWYCYTEWTEWEISHECLFICMSVFIHWTNQVQLVWKTSFKSLKSLFSLRAVLYYLLLYLGLDPYSWAGSVITFFNCYILVHDLKLMIMDYVLMCTLLIWDLFNTAYRELSFQRNKNVLRRKCNICQKCS